jgi:hypothetical protein
MHDLVKAVIVEATRRGAVIDPVAHFDLIVELDALARGFTRPPIDERLIVLDRPIVLSPGVTVRRLSEAACAWLVEYPGQWWRDQQDLRSLATAWAYCNARDRAAIENMPATSFAALQRLNAWRRSLDIPFDSIVAAVQSLESDVSPDFALLKGKDPDADNASNEPPPTCGQVYAALMREHSCSLEYLLFDISSEQLDLLIDALSTRNLALSIVSETNGKIETEAARRRRHNWTRGKTAFLKIVLPEVPANG